MNLADELAAVARAQRLATEALATVEPLLLRAQLSVLTAQALVGATGFALAAAPLPEGAAEALRGAFADADRANWALVEALRAAAGAPAP